MVKFIIALLAVVPDSYIDFAQANFSQYSEYYLLQKEVSSPHITLAQFYGDDADREYIEAHFHQGKHETCFEPRFIAMSFKKDNDENQIWWAEITVARDAPILSLQQEVESLLVDRERKLINATGDLFNPHLTLARIKTNSVNVNLAELPMQGEFKLVIGRADEYGQFVELLSVF